MSVQLCRLDSRPKKMFKDFVRRTVEEKIYKVTYLDDAKVFQFGPIFTGAHRLILRYFLIFFFIYLFFKNL